MKVKFLLVVSMLFLSGCATVSYTPYDLQEPSRVVKSPAGVVIISDTSQITKPYREIGIVEASSEYSSSSELMEALRKEAAKRGADAVINIQETSSNKTSEGIGSWIGGTTGYFVGNTYVSGTPGFYMPGGSNVSSVLKVRGTAIIFTEEK